MSNVTRKQKAPKTKRAGQSQTEAQTVPPPINEKSNTSAASSCSPVGTPEEQDQQGQTAPAGKLPTQAEIDAEAWEIIQELFKKHEKTWKELAKY